MLRHIEADNKGAVVSFGKIVDTLIPAHIQDSFAGDRSSRYCPQSAHYAVTVASVGLN
jgi:hypothetical protein